MPSFFQDPTVSLTPTDLARATKAAQARANAQKSTGPRTSQGKAISSQNAMKHGFASANPVIALEDREAWEAHLTSYMDRFQPADQPEADTVRRAALAMWKYDRLTQLEAALFNLEFEYHQVSVDAFLGESVSKIHQMAIAFKESAGDRAFDLCRRYLHSASRDYDLAIRTFYLLESKRKAAVAAAPKDAKSPANNREQNEPTRNASQPAVVTSIGDRKLEIHTKNPDKLAS